MMVLFYLGIHACILPFQKDSRTAPCILHLYGNTYVCIDG